MPLYHTYMYACLRFYATYNYKAHNRIGNILHVHVMYNWHLIVVSSFRYIHIYKFIFICEQIFGSLPYVYTKVCIIIVIPSIIKWYIFYKKLLSDILNCTGEREREEEERERNKLPCLFYTKTAYFSFKLNVK